MAKLTTVEKPIQLELFEIIKFQLISHCFLNNILLNETELNCLAFLGMRGESRLIEFCKLAVEMKFLGSTMAVNNCLARVERSKLFLKEGAGKKMIRLNPELGIQTKGNIFLNYKILRVEPDKLQGSNKTNSTAAQPA